MKANTTHITLILDRSGSMNEIRDDTIGGFNAFLKTQKEAPGTATLTLVQFDNQNPYEVIHRGKPLAEVPNLDRATFVPRGGTPLLDALGRGINDLEADLAVAKPEERPAKVIFAVVTDGQENASVEFCKKRIVRMIAEKKEKNGWQFVFLSADLDAIGDAREYGFNGQSTMAFAKTAEGMQGAWKTLARRTSAYRQGQQDEMSLDDPQDPPAGAKS